MQRSHRIITMLFIKPIFKTLIIAAALFFILVYLGMKYHWVASFNNNPTKVELSIPAQPLMTDEPGDMKIEGDSKDFQPSLIQSQEASVSLVNMDKGQITQKCQQLYKKTTDRNLFEIAVGDCVVSNFKVSYQEDEASKTLDNKQIQSTQNRQIQIQRKNVEKQCQQTITKAHYNNETERQLLVGICVSDKLNH